MKYAANRQQTALQKEIWGPWEWGDEFLRRKKKTTPTHQKLLERWRQTSTIETRKHKTYYSCPVSLQAATKARPEATAMDSMHDKQGQCPAGVNQLLTLQTPTKALHFPQLSTFGLAVGKLYRPFSCGV